MGTGEAGRQNVSGLHLVPGVRALLTKELGHGGDGVVVADGLAAVLTVEHGDGQTPAALAADAPVGPLPDHGLHPVNAPARDPPHVVAGGHGLLLEGVYRAEPLGGSPENDGILAAPAVGVGVDDVLAGEEGAALLHIGQNDGIGLLGLHAGVFSSVIGVAAPVVHGHHHLDFVAFAGLVVVCAKAGGGVDTAGA